MSILGLLPMLTLCVGFYFLIRLRFFFLLHPIKTVKKTFFDGFDKKARRSLSLALAGTLGVGNIVGVAYGISVGGAGCLFWIFVSGAFSAVIKYCESALSANFSEGCCGGMMYVITRAMGRVGAALGKIYSLLCVFLAFFMGAALQSSSVVIAAQESFGGSTFLFSTAFAFIVFLTVWGGVKKIEKFTAATIPVATIVYAILSVAVIATGERSLADVLGEVLDEAFSFRSASGGVLAFLSSSAMREGFARGLLSNEAGAGTSSIAQSRATGAHPAKVGLFGVCEVFFDTTLLCTLTGLCVLSSGVSYGKTGIETVIKAFSTLLSDFAAPTVFLLIFAFAYSTAVCWYFYATEAFSHLCGDGKNSIIAPAFFAFLLFGAQICEDTLMLFSDTALFLMSILTLLTLIKNSERIVFLSEQYGLLKSKHSDVG